MNAAPVGGQGGRIEPERLAVGLVVQHTKDAEDDAAILWDEVLTLPGEEMALVLATAVGAAAVALQRAAEAEGKPHEELAQEFAFAAHAALDESLEEQRHAELFTSLEARLHEQLREHLDDA